MLEMLSTREQLSILCVEDLISVINITDCVLWFYRLCPSVKLILLKHETSEVTLSMCLEMTE